MDPAYSDLRGCICVDQSELSLFRQLVVNTVLATDIFDQELRTIRTNSWNKAFGGASHDDSPQDFTNRRATVVIQHIVMAADVAHTMQDVSALLSTRPQCGFSRDALCLPYSAFPVRCLQEMEHAPTSRSTRSIEVGTNGISLD
jgi:hypothetical protein